MANFFSRHPNGGPFFSRTRAFKNMRIDGLVSKKISACSRRVDFFQKRVEILLNRRLSMPCYLCTKIVKKFVDSQNVPWEISFHYERNIEAMKTGYGSLHAEIYPRHANVKFGHRKCSNSSKKGPSISSLEKNMRFSRRSKFPHFLEFPGNNLNAKIYPRMFFIHFHIVPFT